MTVRYELRGPAAWITIDLEERRNALVPEVIQGLLDSLERATSDDLCRVVVITGAGDKAFSAGGDIGAFAQAAGREGARPPELIGRLLGAVQGHPKPVVARVNGRALGGGFGLMLACDLVVAAEGAEIGTPEINIGLWPHVITAVIQRNLPRKVALELMLTGRRYPVADALRWGIVNRVVPAQDLDEAVEELTGELAGKSPAILRLGKRSFTGAQDLSFDEAIAFLGEMLARNLKEQDLAEGVAAFLEKRRPDWKG